MFYPVKNPPQWMLDNLMADEKRAFTSCPDCGVKIGDKHAEGCDVAQCLNTKQQRLGCDCGDCGDDVWTGLWPNIKEAYEWKLVVYDTASNQVMFNLNEAGARIIRAAREGKTS